VLYFLATGQIYSSSFFWFQDYLPLLKHPDFQIMVSIYALMIFLCLAIRKPMPALIGLNWLQFLAVVTTCSYFLYSPDVGGGYEYVFFQSFPVLPRLFILAVT